MDRIVPIRSTLAGDPAFAPLLESYLRKIPQWMVDIETARQRADREGLCRLVHRIRGTAGNYGFPRITEIAAACESVLRDSARAPADAPLDRLLAILRAATD
jgi:HPt (histidine-containing phosphotransfer) domain-containing protein